METLGIREARRLALIRAGLLKPEWTGLPRRATGRGLRSRRAAHAVIGRFGYLQLDTISVVGARSHVLVLLSRLDGFEPEMGECLLQPGEPLFEYWGHEASWLPLDLYPTMGFRRRDFVHHPWWGDILGQHPEVGERVMQRIRDEGPLRSVDFEGNSGSEMWEIKIAKMCALQLWLRGELAIRERSKFQRVFDLTERVIPAELRDERVEQPEAVRALLLRALAGHGWAQTGTLTATWRLRNMRQEVATALEELVDAGAIVRCALDLGKKRLVGWIRPSDLELAARSRGLRPPKDRGVLLSPFDPLLWDRARAGRLFDFEMVLEIYKPKAERIYGYYCLPVLAGERLVARIDLKADRKAGRLEVQRLTYESPKPTIDVRQATRQALGRYADSVRLAVRQRAS